MGGGRVVSCKESQLPWQQKAFAEHISIQLIKKKKKKSFGIQFNCNSTSSFPSKQSEHPLLWGITSAAGKPHFKHRKQEAILQPHQHTAASCKGFPQVL